MNPTISVHNFVRHIIFGDTIDWVAKVLLAGHKSGATDEHQGGYAIMKLKNLIINHNLAPFDHSFEVLEDIHEIMAAILCSSHLIRS